MSTITTEDFARALRNASAETRRLNPLSNDVPPPPAGKLQPSQGTPCPVNRPATRGAADIVLKPSTDEAKLNKTERAFLQWLRALGEYRNIDCQAVTLKLGDDCRYTPDLTAIHCATGARAAFEVKGFMRDDALVKLKVAARKFRWLFHFLLVRREKSGNWKITEVKP